MKVLDLFSGIGGFSVGLERVGFKTIAFCEIDEHARKVLNKNWPGVPVYEDVKNIKGDQFKDIEVICGGFPCPDVSVAGKQKGFIDENGNTTRSGLWFEYARIIREIRPRYVIIENVANLRSKGLVRVLKDLWEVGYNAEWHIISARSLGAPHLRERIWIIATPANANDFRLWCPSSAQEEKPDWWAKASASFSHWWETEPSFCRVANGLPRELDGSRAQRIKQLGNSVVPFIPELIGRAIRDYELRTCDFLR